MLVHQKDEIGKLHSHCNYLKSLDNGPYLGWVYGPYLGWTKTTY